MKMEWNACLFSDTVSFRYWIRTPFKTCLLSDVNIGERLIDRLNGLTDCCLTGQQIWLLHMIDKCYWLIKKVHTHVNILVLNAIFQRCIILFVRSIVTSSLVVSATHREHDISNNQSVDQQTALYRQLPACKFTLSNITMNNVQRLADFDALGFDTANAISAKSTIQITI